MIVHKMVDIGGDASCHICVQNELTEKHPLPQHVTFTMIVMVACSVPFYTAC